MKLLAANWNTLIGLLSLAITKYLWKVDLRFKYFKGEPNRNVISKINPENWTIIQQGMFSYV